MTSSTSQRVENGPEPTPELLALIFEAVDERKQEIENVPRGGVVVPLKMSPCCQNVVYHFMREQYPNVRFNYSIKVEAILISQQITSSILDPKKHTLRWLNTYIFEEGELEKNPKGRALIILPLKVIDIQLQGDITLEVGRSIFVNEDCNIKLCGEGKLFCINLGIMKSG